jgi:cytochrome c oxidase subunit 2
MRFRIAKTIALGVALASSLALATDPGASATKIEVVAKRFTFAPDHITVKRGQVVTLVLRSTDVTHGLEVKGLNFNVEIRKGAPTEIQFSPKQTGTFEGKCSHFCGVGHGSMHFTVEVVE